MAKKLIELDTLTARELDYTKQHKFNVTSFDNETKVKIVEDFTYNLLTRQELVKKYNSTLAAIDQLINRHRDAINNKAEMMELIETGNLKGDEYKSRSGYKTVVNPTVINKSFLTLLSPDHDPILTQAESIYAWTYAHLGDNTKAIEESGLDKYLPKAGSKKGTNTVYNNAVKVRGYYLRRKPNILKYIKEIQMNYLQDLDVDKVYVQSEIIQQIEQMKEAGDPKRSKDILKAIEMLGRTVGAFTDIIKVEEASAGDALDHLIEMAQEAVIVEEGRND